MISDIEGLQLFRSKSKQKQIRKAEMMSEFEKLKKTFNVSSSKKKGLSEPVRSSKRKSIFMSGGSKSNKKSETTGTPSVFKWQKLTNSSDVTTSPLSRDTPRHTSRSTFERSVEKRAILPYLTCNFGEDSDSGDLDLPLVKELPTFSLY